MSGIVTDVERPSGHSTPRSERSGLLLRRGAGPVLIAVAVALCTALPLLSLDSPAGAASISSLKAQAASIESQINADGIQISALGQKYDEAENQISTLTQQIAATQTTIATDKQHVAHDQVTLRTAALNNYMSDGSAADANPLFASNQQSFGEQREYSQVAEGNLGTAVANLHTAQVQLDVQENSLNSQKQQQEAAASAAANAKATADQEQANEQSELNSINGQVQLLVNQAQEAANIAQATVTQQRLVSNGYSQIPPPPSAGGAAGVAVAAAESQLGVPYVWGGETPGVGFDCSGLTAWAWTQAGVPLPHYSGSQMADTTPVPVSDLEPGDLLFYGPGGSEHVAMYIGGGRMIEAPYTGAYVWITALRLGDGFVGAGRP
jgi:peptidoglycan DL-endopeptidase CwlO